jgi:hypothetical protein
LFKLKSRRKSRGRSRFPIAVARTPLAGRSQPSLSLWDSLSPERKLDVVGVVLALVGVLILLGLLASSPSVLTGGIIQLLGQLMGWGLYFLPVALIVWPVAHPAQDRADSTAFIAARARCCSSGR